LLDLGIYGIDFIRLVAQSDPRLLQAFVVRDQPQGVDMFTHGIFRVGEITATMTCSFTFDANYYVLSGSKGSVASLVAISGRNLPNILRIHLLEGDRKYEQQLAPENPYKAEIEYFARCIVDGTDPFPGMENSLRNLEILDDIRSVSTVMA
jgi:predicted dehydrogenase